ncbi:MAG: phytanoyl-CoA dioxygenase family protein, partial [Alphaproteobacteria bacterium]|nr:phytanoyl-CoA dioxygenase family protein [Alphaproteobacteria bacterium]
MPRVLSDAQLKHYQRDGFVSPIECISAAEAAAYLRKIEAYEATVGEDVSKTIRVRAVLAFKWLIDLARHPRIAGALQDAIGPNVLLFLSGVWSKRPGTDTFVSWHQDGAYNPFDRNDGATAWIALTDSTPEKGNIRVIPGSQRHIIPHDETYDASNILSRGQTVPGIDAAAAVDMPLRAGQFSIHHELAVHGSAPNRTGERRLGISFACVPTEAKPLSGPDTG